MPRTDPGSAPVPRSSDRLHTWGAAIRAAIRRTRRWLPSLSGESLWPELTAIGCFLILPWIGITAALEHEYRHAKAAAVESTANLARALEETTRRTVGQIDYILLSARALRLEEGDRFDFREWFRTQTLPDKMTAQIAIADRTGLVIASTIQLPHGVHIGDRPHFRAQVDPAQDALFISQPMVGRVSGLETIQFSRKLLDRDGQFAGVIVLSLSASELANYYQSLHLGNGFVAIFSPDGTRLARSPYIPGYVGAPVTVDSLSATVMNLAAGSVELPATPVRGTQIASFRRLQEYPLIVMVGIDTETVLEPFLSLRNTAAPSGAAITLAVGLIGFLWVRQKQRSLVSRRALTVTLGTISQGVVMVDRQGDVSVVNPRVLDLLGRPDGLEDAEIPGGNIPDAALKFIALRANELAASQAASAAMVPSASHEDASLSTCESRFETTLGNGSVIEVRTHTLPDGGFVQTYTDITEQREAHAQVFHLAHHDNLTGLANRAALMQRISKIVDQDASRDDLTALVMIDLDGFKAVNDTLGHDAGDALLIEVGRRLWGLVRASDVVARLGGDEFVLLLPALHQRDDVIPLADRVLRRLADPMRLQGQQVRIGASLGIAFHPIDGLDADTWLKHADMALYSAKNGGRGLYRCFDEQLAQAVSEQRLLESDLRRALDNDELEVHFQPKFASATLALDGFEALARWRHPSRGYVSPAVFIGIAESSGLINRLGRQVLEQACRCAATWETPYPVAVNVSVMQLRDGRLRDQIAAALADNKLAPAHLEIEVTESVMAEDNPILLANLKAIKAMGLPIALDDFGTGYSSLSYLRRFPFDKIKIDRSFVQGQADDPGMRVILEAILDMCHNLGLGTIGEGIETQAQLDVLRDRGCTEVQGYFLGRPMPSDQVQDYIRNMRPAAGETVTSEVDQGDVALVP